MSIEGNKRLVAEFNSYFEHSDIDAILGLMADDASWWINGKPDLFPLTGTITKAEFADINRDMHASLEGGMKMDVVGMVAEGDQVAAEMRAHAVTKAGRVYDNDYHMLFTVQHGKIAAVRQYTDLMTVADVLSLPAVTSVGVVGAPRKDRDADATHDPSAPAEALSLDGDKRLIAEFLGHFGEGDIDAVLDKMTDDATWWLNGRPDLFPGAGIKTKAEFEETLHQIYARLDGGLQMTPETMVAEGDRVAAQVRSHGLTKQGKVYQNGFLMLFTLRDRKIASVKEYTDLLHAAEVFA